MGANQTEYANSFRNNSAEDLKNNVDESRFGNAYQKHMGKMALPGAMAPMVGMMGSTVLQGSADYSQYADVALGAGSALGAVAAPLMYRSATKQLSNNAVDMNQRTQDLEKGKRQTGAQRADTVLNAGTAVQKAGMGAMGAAYGANALSGGTAISGGQMLGLSKASSALTPGGFGVNSALVSQGQNPLAAFTTDAAGKAGSVDYGSIGLGGGDMAGMAVMMAAMMGGQKLTKSIKGMANSGGNSKYKYRSASLNTPAPDRDLNKYNVLGSSFGAQVNLLMMTDKLSPYENLALTALSAIAKNTGAGPALFQFLTGKEDMGSKNLKLSHNKMSNMMGQDDEFSSLSGHTSAQKKGSITQLVEQYAHVMESIDRTILGVSKGIQGAATAVNPLNILFGGLFGPSAEKQISGLFGLDDEGIRNNAIDRTAKNLNLPVSMVAIAETPADKILKMAGDDPDAKKIAALQLIAEINRNQLLLMLEEKNKDNGGFIGKTQEQFEIMDTNTGVEGALKKFRGLVGTVPGLGLIASILALREAREKSKEKDVQRLADDLDYQMGRKDDSLTHEALANSFLGTEFPILFLDSMDLDTERNILLTEIRDMVEQQSLGSDSTAIKARRAMYPRKDRNNTWDMVTGSIMSNQEADENKKKDFAKNEKEIKKFFIEALKKHPGEKKAIAKKRKEELEALKNKHSGGELSLQEGKDQEEKEKREKLLTKVLVKLEKTLNSKPKGNIKNSSTGATAPNTSFLQRFFGGGLKGKLWSAGKATMGALLAVFQLAVQHGKKVLIGGAALAYLGYRLSKTEFGKELASKVAGAYTFMEKQAKSLGITTGGVAAVASTVVMASIFKDLYLVIPAKNRKMRAAIGIMALAAMGTTAFASIGFVKQLKSGSIEDVLSSLPVVGSLMKSLGLGKRENVTENEKTISTIYMILEGLGMMLLGVKNPWAKGAGAIILLGTFLAKGGGDKIKMMLAKGKDAFGVFIKELLGDGVVGKKAFNIIDGKLGLTGNSMAAQNDIIEENTLDYTQNVGKYRKDIKSGRFSKEAIENSFSAEGNDIVRDKLLALQASYDEKDGKKDGKIEGAKFQNEYMSKVLKILEISTNQLNETTAKSLARGDDQTDGQALVVAEIRNMTQVLKPGQKFKMISSVKQGKIQYEFN